MKLENGVSRVEMKLALGGAVGSLSHAGRDLLVPTPLGTRSLSRAACIPLIPAFGRPYLEWDEGAGDAAPLPTVGERGGHGWEECRVLGDELGMQCSVHTHEGWAQSIQQNVALVEGGCRLLLGVRNDTAEPQTGAVGFRCRLPYAAGATVILSDDASGRCASVALENAQSALSAETWRCLTISDDSGNRTVLVLDRPVRFSFRVEANALVVSMLAHVAFERSTGNSNEVGNSVRLALTVTG